ncbi:MAG: division/cell wall cluster transcriptional repressor MraZ [Gammaproteobacteria bacterium]|nr:division/cell wall cluster transcriptional repressor MraZ [Gammaproteobacteria bacterium]
MFRGISVMYLDEKGRMAIPSRYRDLLRDQFNSQLVATIDTEETCLLIYPLPEWNLIQQKIENLPTFNPIARRIQRLLIGYATDLEMDKSGRVLIPPLLREYGKLTKGCILVGQGKKFELWDEANWNARRDNWLTEGFKGEWALPPEMQSLSL